MSRHTGRSAARGATVFLRTGARPSVLGLLLAGLLLAAACGHKTSAAQTLRTCVDRWNQGNMVGWGPAPVNVSFRRPVAKERAAIQLSASRQCIVSIAAGRGTWTCVLTTSGAYWCPPLHEPTGPPLMNKNAAIDRRGVLELDSPLKGTHPTPPLAWQRYPHVDGFVEPWTSSGTLRAGLRFKGEGRGSCVVVDETAIFGISCLTASLRRYEACFPQRQDWRAGDVAACAGLGYTRFVRWTITGPNPDAQELRTCADRWTQGNMLGWGPTQASVGVAIRRVKAGQASRCVVALAVHYKRDPRSGCSGSPAVPGHPGSCVDRGSTYVCVLNRFGAYACPSNAEGSPPLRHENATTDERGVLRLDKPLAGTHPTPPLGWQRRYPHIRGWIEPWTASGKLRRGLRLESGHRGPCFGGSYETQTDSVLRCRGPDLGAFDPCFPETRDWRDGGVAACAEAPGDTAFTSWVISGDLSDPPLLVPWRRVGDISLGEPKKWVLRAYGAEPELGYRLHGGKVQVAFDGGGRVASIWFSTRYYRTKSGFGVGSRIPLGPCHRTPSSRCEHRWHGFVWNEWVREKPCGCWTKVGRGAQSLPVTVKNFLKPWFFIDVRDGRVSGFYFASRFVD